jgi:hypothetical protein
MGAGQHHANTAAAPLIFETPTASLFEISNRAILFEISNRAILFETSNARPFETPFGFQGVPYGLPRF